MKNLIFKLVALFTLAFTFASCDKEETITVDNLPTQSNAFITEHFAGVKVVSVIQEKESFGGTEFKVVLENGVELKFDNNGNWKEVEAKNQSNAIPTTFIPQAIVDYVNTNYPNVGINGIDKDSSGFDVELTNGIDLEFDAEGKFLRIDS